MALAVGISTVAILSSWNRPTDGEIAVADGLSGASSSAAAAAAEVRVATAGGESSGSASRRANLSDEERARVAGQLRERALALLQRRMEDRDSQEHFAEAFELFRQAAEQGSIEALRDMAYMAERGLGTTVDPEAALEYFLRAALAGDAHSMLQVGDYLDGGRGVPRNDLLAAEWYAEAAAAGIAEASARLGSLYASGRGVPQDYATAIELYREAAAGGSSKGDFLLGLAYLEGWGVDADLDSALGHLTAAAEAGDPQAQYALYKLYGEGGRAPADPEAAERWLKQAVLGGERDPLRALVNSEQYRGAALSEAIDLLGGLADRSESAAAHYELARMSFKHDISPSGLASAIALADSAAQLGDPRALRMLASISAKIAETPRMQSLSRMVRPPEELIAEGVAQQDVRLIYAQRLMEREGLTAFQAIEKARSASKEQIYLYGAEYRAAGDRPEDRRPVLSEYEAPRYPEGLALQGFGGLVVLDLTVSETGEVQQARVVNREHPELEAAALEAVRQWKFEPRLQDGKPASATVRVPVGFRH